MNRAESFGVLVMTLGAAALLLGAIWAFGSDQAARNLAVIGVSVAFIGWVMFEVGGRKS